MKLAVDVISDVIGAQQPETFLDAFRQVQI